ncbi:MAG: hypothetical protein RMJ33_02415 [Saprospiraceae bacterium]|nr:hypothetical protein [Saprospiraceae bacterium]MDW8228669.1 hypothetical protein [Saprospiraceae bacterium]
MHSLLATLHSYNRYLILAALLFVLFRAFSGWLGRRPYGQADNTGSLVLVSLAHLQLLIGLVMWGFTSSWTQTAFANMGLAMKDPNQRYWAVEHLVAMLIAIVLIQLGRTFAKKTADPTAKHRKTAIYTTIAALIIIVTLGQKGLLIGSRYAG